MSSRLVLRRPRRVVTLHRRPEEVSSSILQGGLEGVRKVVLVDLVRASMGGRGVLRLVWVLLLVCMLSGRSAGAT